MYILSVCFLQLLYSILLHNGKALTFALISCEDSVLLFNFILYQSILGQGLSSSVLQCKNLGQRGVAFLHPPKPLYPYYQLPTTSLTRPGLSTHFFLLELLGILPSISTDATSLKSVSDFPDTSRCPKTLFPDCPMEGGVPCHLPFPVVPSPSPAKMWNQENVDSPSYLASFIYPPSAMAVAVQRKPTVTNIESIPVLGQMLKGLKVADAFRL